MTIYPDSCIYGRQRDDRTQPDTKAETKVYEIEEIKSRLAPIFGANGVRSAVLFGSYAKGLATEKSDVDIFVDSGLKGLDFVGLAEYIREALEKEVDVIDVEYLKKGSRIEDEIRETGVRIYGR